MMKKLILSLAALFAAGALWAQTSVDTAAEGAVAAAETAAGGEKSEWLSAFAALDVRGPILLRLVRVPDTEAPRIVYDTKGCTTSKFRAEVKDKVLRISERADSHREERTTVVVYYNTLESLLVSDATVRFDATFSAVLFDLRLEGQALVEGDIDIRDLDIDASGKCRATLSGRVDYLTLALSTGDMSCYGLEVKSLQASVSGSGKAEFRVTERLVSRTTTGGKVGYKGSPTIVRDASKFMGGGTLRID